MVIWSTDSCQIKVSGDQYHMTISQDQGWNSLRYGIFLKLTADQVIYFHWIAGSSVLPNY